MWLSLDYFVCFSGTFDSLFYASGSLQWFYQCCNFLCALANPYLAVNYQGHCDRGLSAFRLEDFYYLKLAAC